MVSPDPLVSIIMPAYNAERTLDESVESVRAQTWTNWELLLVVDAATDGTLDKASRWAEIDQRILLLVNSTNIGVAASRNKGLDLAKGQYVTFLDSDDLWHPERLRIQVCYMQEQGISLSYSAYQRFNENGHLNVVLPPASITFSEMLKGSVIAIMTGMLHSNLASNLRFQDIGHEDYLFWLQALRCVPQANRVPIRDPMAFYRVQLYSRSANIWRNLGWQWAIYRTHLSLPWYQSVVLMAHYGLRALHKRFSFRTK